MREALNRIPAAKIKQVRPALEELFYKYRLYKHHSFHGREAQITSSSEPRYHGQTNQITDQTGNIAAWNVDERAERNAYCEHIEQAVEKLPDVEKKLIVERYLCRNAEYITDSAVYNFKFDSPVSAVTYMKIRNRAFARLADMLGIASIDYLRGEMKIYDFIDSGQA